MINYQNGFDYLFIFIFLFYLYLVYFLYINFILNKNYILMHHINIIQKNIMLITQFFLYKTLCLLNYNFFYEHIGFLKTHRLAVKGNERKKVRWV